MSKKKLCKIEEIQLELKSTLSEKRYKHCLGVKKELEYLFEKYGTFNEIVETENYDAASFIGLCHDWAREFSDEELRVYCEKEAIALDVDEKRVIVLAHGKVASSIAKKRCLTVPRSWYVAINSHTSGDENMGYLGLALFIADFIEESRTFLTQEDRDYYHSFNNLNEIGKHVLDSMLEHWHSKGVVASKKTMELKSFWDEEKVIN